ncbi:hypothetical protein HYH03_015981 [Edaphochlamys debaryana]|uniref:BTB domain-containing protein n=1 Tax=Edaphochlamys debaryana TaxID=47281 RepID=A0A836BQR5_9CHLO|nr:hypothetical protein HYH03_015981 [Edaphochlamys debaryana]|eukprot:KAG2485307.1 hypothetical protein HYH03_015981 [Edaphochlamys debaryana]
MESAETVTLVCKGGAAVKVRIATLAAASPVLRDALSLPPSKPGELRLEEDDPGAWGAALRLLDPEGHAEGALLSWDNLEASLCLAHKYDIRLVRVACAGFLGSCHMQVSLTRDLASPMNALVAASLVEQYLSLQPELQPLLQHFFLAFNSSLTVSWGIFPGDFAKGQLARLRSLTQLPDYKLRVTLGVQMRVLEALVEGLIKVCPQCLER